MFKSLRERRSVHNWTSGLYEDPTDVLLVQEKETALEGSGRPRPSPKISLARPTVRQTEIVSPRLQFEALSISHDMLQPKQYHLSPLNFGFDFRFTDGTGDKGVAKW